ncbi:SLC13 family permease, partial [Salegentibacter sp.]|uniref:SLC13 family permease n=1 Tax=Salegentibacter sp. TaxID=1903072 RepID=UPI00356ABE6C
MTHNIVFGTLILTFGLFAWGRIRHDFVALIALFILIVTGIIDPTDAFSGFGHPAVITVASVLIIGKAFEFSGLIDLLGKWIMKIGDQLLVQILVLSLLVALASAFMNNVGALAITMPIAIHLARKSGNPPSYILMPIAFASLLGGMTTLIGTPPNIIIATFRADVTGESFNMFDFTPVGLTLMLAGLVFIVLFGWRLLPERIGKKSEDKRFDIDDYITEVEVAEDSKVIGKPISELADISDTDVLVLGLVRNNKLIHAPDINYVLLEKDIILLETDADDLKTFIEDTKVKLVGDKKFLKDAEGSDKI